jgi:hypothetical protein
MSDVDGVTDRDRGETWHLRQLWQFAKNRGYSIKLEDDRIWLTPGDHGSTASGRSFPDTRAGMQAARKWLNKAGAPDSVQSAVGQSTVGQPTLQERVARGVGRGAGAVLGYIIGFVVASGIIGGVVSWWNDTHYSSEYDNAFLSNCEAQPGATASYCGCAPEQVHERYSPKEAAQVIVPGSSAVTSIASSCAGQ